MLHKYKKCFTYVGLLVFGFSLLTVITSCKNVRSETHSLSTSVNMLIIEPPRVRINVEGIASQLTKILQGDGFKEVNIAITGPDQPDQRNLTGWFHDPNHQADKRWRNLRGEDGVRWDYVIILESPQVIESFPGWYAQGVHDIAAEVERGTGEAVLFMQWPNPYSKVPFTFYEEVSWRVGLGRGLKVIPAGPALNALKEKSGNEDTDYMAAACIYSRLWNKSAAASSYVHNDVIADAVHAVVMSPVNTKPYTGNFTALPYGIHTIKGNQNRHIRIRNDGHHSGGWPVENGINDMAKKLVNESGLIYREIPGELIGSRLPKDVIADNADLHFRHFWYLEPPEIRATNAALYMPFAFIDDGDRVPPQFKADFLKIESFTHSYFHAEKWMRDRRIRQLPHALLWAQTYRQRESYDDAKLMEWPDRLMMASYMLTMATGRCAVPLINDGSIDYQMIRTGYETVWRLSTLHGKTPGFKTWPLNRLRLTADSEDDVALAVAFAMQPTANVTVTIACSEQYAQATPQSLTFTPENYNKPQSIKITVSKEAKPSAPFDVLFTTSSDDLVYDNHMQSWTYKVNNAPVANDHASSVPDGIMSAIQLSGSDSDHEALTYVITKKPANGTVAIAGSVAAYTPNPGFTGSDSFTFKTKDFSRFSPAATVSIDVKSSSPFGKNLLVNGDAELIPFDHYGWVKHSGEWVNATHRLHSGKASFHTAKSDVAELYQDVDVSTYAETINAGQQTFKLDGHFKRNCNKATPGRMSVVIECRDASGKVLKVSSIEDVPDSGRFDNKPFIKQTAEFEAAPGTTSLRVRLITENPLGRKNECYFDALTLEALQPRSK